MSEASRAIALQHAATVHTASGDADAVLAAAERFHAFIVGGEEKAPAKATAVKPAAAAKPKAPPTKAAPEPEPEATVTKEQVGESIEAMLNANMRNEAIALFKKYGAKSLSGVKPEDYGQIKQDADDALLNA